MAGHAVHITGASGLGMRKSEAFIAWSADYDSGIHAGRNLARHEAWLASLPCPVLRLDGTEPVDELAQKVKEAIDD